MVIVKIKIIITRKVVTKSKNRSKDQIPDTSVKVFKNNSHRFYKDIVSFCLWYLLVISFCKLSVAHYDLNFLILVADFKNLRTSAPTEAQNIFRAACCIVRYLEMETGK